MARQIPDDTVDREQFRKDVGKRIAKRRTELNLTQEELAEKSSLTQQQISYAERGEKGLRNENLLKVAQALNVSTDYLMTGNYAETDLGIMLSEVSDEIKDLNLEERILLCKSISLYVQAIKVNHHSV